MAIVRSLQPHATSAEMFWGEIAPCEHLVQLYDDDAVFLDSLEGFVVGGIEHGDGVIAIATAAHLETLAQRIARRGIDLARARAEDRYIALEASHALSHFMVGGWPDDGRFRDMVAQLLERARGPGRRVRAFGEMVAVMWARGDHGATVRLEHLWHQLCLAQGFSLFCAYPKSGFTQDMRSSIEQICATHSRVLS